MRSVSRSRIACHFFDRRTGWSGRFDLPDPPPKTIDLPTFVGERLVKVGFRRLFFVPEGLDGVPHVTYASIRGKRGERRV